MPVQSSSQVVSLVDLESFWRQLLPQLGPQSIVLLRGDVGAGKTTSVQLIAQLLGMKNVQSPSFAIHLRYENSQGRCLDHVDLYRLKDDDDLESSGFWDLFAQKESLVIIEWAQRLSYEYLPLNWQKIEVTLEKTAVEDQRLIAVKPLL